MYGFILVSHSQKIAQGVKELIEQMVNDTDQLKVMACGGTEDGEIGTSPPMVQAAIEDLKETQHIFIFTDIGSSTMSSEMAVEMVEDSSLSEKISLMEKPIVEGAFEAAVKASVNQSVDEIKA